MNDTNTYIKLKDKPKDNFPEFIIVHHTGGTEKDPKADTSHHTAEIMETHHLSLGWEGLGYQYVIHKNGDIWKGRPEHYHGAHTTTHNKKSIGICLSGNFDLTLPTDAQIKALTTLLADIKSRYFIPDTKILPHRKFAKKSCYGNRLSDDWAKNLVQVVKPTKEEILKKVEELRLLVLAS